MSAEHARDDFDWVTAQSKCNASLMFDRLLAGATEDVQRRNSLEDHDDGAQFEVHEDEEGFEVSRVVAGVGGSRTAAFVRFVLEGRRIHVHGDGVDVAFTTVVAIDPTGACRFLIGEAMYSDWEIRRMALEQLFFEGDDSSL